MSTSPTDHRHGEERTWRLTVVEDTSELGRVGADLVERQVRRHPATVLGLAAGSSPVPVYRELARRSGTDGLSFDGVIAFLLDEYVGLGRDDPRSFFAQLRADVADPLGLPSGALHGLDGLAPDLSAECRSYEEAITSAGGVDLQLLGIGGNGHLAFNEPGSPLDSRTRPVELAAATRADNAGAFGGPELVPAGALTQGIGTVLRAQRLVLVASGPSKAAPLAAALVGPVGRDVPASALQHHPRVEVVADRPAAAALPPAVTGEVDHCSGAGARRRR